MGRYQLTLFAIVTITGLLAIASCAGNSSSRSQLDRAMSFMNRHDYASAADILEDEHRKSPSDSSISFLLAQAELGQAHFEMFDFISQIMGGQNPSQYIDLSITPDCSTDAITKLAGYDMRCLLYRILQHLPDAESPHFRRAETLLKETFPKPEEASSEIDFVIAFVDASSALSHFRTLILQENERFYSFGHGVTEEQFKFLVHELKLLLADIKDCMERLKHSYGKLRKFVSNAEGKPIVKIGAREIGIDQIFQGPEIFRFAAQVADDHIDSINDQINAGIGKSLEEINSRLGNIVNRISSDYFSPDGSLPPLQLAWKFNSAIKMILEGAVDSGSSDSGTLSPHEIFWRHSPRLFEDFYTACVNAWNQETRKPLLDYFASTREQWIELSNIVNTWSDWFGYLDKESRESLRKHLFELSKKDPRFALPPSSITDQEIEKWERGVLSALQDDAEAALKGEVQDLPSFTSDQIKDAQSLLTRTAAWINRNL